MSTIIFNYLAGTTCANACAVRAPACGGGVASVRGGWISLDLAREQAYSRGLARVAMETVIVLVVVAVVVVKRVFERLGE